MASLRTPLPSILNFRDVGETVDQVSGKEEFRRKRLYRAARPDDASPEDRRRLSNEFGVKSIIDLRTKTEHIQSARKRDKRISSAAAVSQSNSVAAETIKIPGISYHEINFNGKAYSDSLLNQLSWTNYLKLISLVTTGFRVEGIRILGENVMRRRGLVGLALDSVDACKKEMRQVFTVLASDESYPIMIHCTQGKDRTGLTVMLALFLCGASIESVTEDYMLSEAELAPELPERMKEIESIGLTEEFAKCSPDLVRRVHEYVVGKYGSVEEYLSGACGVTEDMQGQVRRNLLCELN